MKIAFFNRTFLSILFLFICAAIIRIALLDRIPPSLYSDEVSQGYNAYSILKTGKDEYGTFLPVSFRSFGDWKPPLQTYVMIPTISLFGLNAWGVRLPSAILGSVTVVLVYFLIIELMTYHEHLNSFLSKYTKVIAYTAAVLLTISPWHILHSRAAMLTSIELFCLVAAVLTFYKGLRLTKHYYYLSSFFWVLSLYSYYAMRLITPLFLLFLLVVYRRKIVSQLRSLLGPLCFGIILLFPLMFAFVSEPNVVFGRARTVSIFHDKGTPLIVWELISSDGNISPIIAQFFHNKPYHYGFDILRRFLQHLDGRFLFLIGDQHPPFQIPNMGILFLIDGFFLLIGGIICVRQLPHLRQVIIFWIFVSILPASLTFVTPAANRTITMIVPLLFLSSLGLWKVISSLRNNWRPLFIIIIISIYCIHAGYFVKQYVIDLPNNHAGWWHYGYDRLYAYLKSKEVETETIAISARASVPYIFMLFYNKVDPSTIATYIHRNYEDDEFGFEHVDSFGKYRFPRHFTWEKDGTRLLEGTYLVVIPNERVGEEARQVAEITYPDGTSAYKIYVISSL